MRLWSVNNCGIALTTKGEIFLSNEEKIIEMLTTMQKDMALLKTEINDLKEKDKLKELETHCGTVEEQKEAWRKMSNLLTKEEGDALAIAVGERS